MHIRPYRASDRADLFELLRLNTPAYFSPSEAEDLETYLDMHLEEYYVLVLEGNLVACGGLNTAVRVGVITISWDMVHPAHQGKGLGRTLTQFRLEKARKKPEMHTIMVRTSQLVFRFYEKMGFSLLEVIPDYWAPGFDLYRMEMPLRAKNILQ